MRQVSFSLPLEENIVKTLPAGTYKVTVTGLTAEGTVSVEPRNAGDSAWNAAVTFTKSDSGIIGSKSVTITASGKVRCSIASDLDPTGVKVRISA